MSTSPPHVLWGTDRPWLIEVSDDSMAPDLCAGDIVAADPVDRRPSPAGLFVIGDGPKLLVRRMELVFGSRPHLVRVGNNLSDNVIHKGGLAIPPDWQEILLMDLDIRGRVMSAFKWMPEVREQRRAARRALEAPEVRSPPSPSVRPSGAAGGSIGRRWRRAQSPTP